MEAKRLGRTVGLLIKFNLQIIKYCIAIVPCYYVIFANCYYIYILMNPNVASPAYLKDAGTFLIFIRFKILYLMIKYALHFL